MMKDLVVFILTYRRPDRVITYNTLKRGGYKGDIYLVVGDDDDTIEEYQKRFGREKVLIFNKEEVLKKRGFDTMDNFGKRNVILYARNVCFEFAKKLGYRYFVQLDDDYTDFSFRFNKKLAFKAKVIKDLQKVFEAMVEFLKETPTTTIAMAQGGDFIGGGSGGYGKAIKLTRKAMNSFICDVEREFDFRGTINEDVNTYTLLGSRGDLFFTFNLVALNQKQTQSNAGGMTGIYSESGTYIKSFYTILGMPSSVRINAMGNKFFRLHHSVEWNKTVPKIIPEEYKKR